MSRVKTIDKFGRGVESGSRSLLRGPPGVGFKHTRNGHFDIEGKLLTNVGEPKNDSDAVTKKYVVGEVHRLRTQIAAIINKDIIDHFKKDMKNLEAKSNMLESKIKKEIYERMADFESRISQLEKKVSELMAANKVRI